MDDNVEDRFWKHFRKYNNFASFGYTDDDRKQNRFKELLQSSQSQIISYLFNFGCTVGCMVIILAKPWNKYHNKQKLFPKYSEVKTVNFNIKA